MTQQSDCLAIVVPEKTGRISGQKTDIFHLKLTAEEAGTHSHGSLDCVTLARHAFVLLTEKPNFALITYKHSHSL